ncbi:tetratricopeptide repeat protein [Leptolyngbya sp. NIES-2104]|uniref:tetratricopeptide repeat protein n=1 Tax=Leptolyngbya sp. NIES-2104 TaxID=1552121 RepID=UPI0006EC7325|nr:tetratricopeptide repeat protein [Leptolyngbya sp. NIES-2104]GAP98370.1 hypothetical protein NIES2104_49250 [Leptolyngbya sp. NIES-2104]
MKAFELPAKIDQNGKIALPNLPLEQIPQDSVIKVIVLVDDSEDEELRESAVESFRQGWADVVSGNTRPVSELLSELDDSESHSITAVSAGAIQTAQHDDNLTQLMISLNALGSLYKEQGRFSEAEAVLTEAIQIAHKFHNAAQ